MYTQATSSGLQRRKSRPPGWGWGAYGKSPDLGGWGWGWGCRFSCLQRLSPDSFLISPLEGQGGLPGVWNIVAPTPTSPKQRCSDWRADGVSRAGQTKDWRSSEGLRPPVSDPAASRQGSGWSGAGWGSPCWVGRWVRPLAPPPSAVGSRSWAWRLWRGAVGQLTRHAAAASLCSGLMWVWTRSRSRCVADPRLRWSRRPRGWASGRRLSSSWRRWVQASAPGGRGVGTSGEVVGVCREADFWGIRSRRDWVGKGRDGRWRT